MYKNILLISDCPVSCYLGGDIDIDIYLTAIGLAPGGGITRHIYNQTIPNLHREKNFEPRENKKQQTASTLFTERQCYSSSHGRVVTVF
jgi:hypothetical protein